MEANLVPLREEKDLVTQETITKEKIKELYFIRRKHATYVADTLGISVKEVFRLVDEIIQETSKNITSNAADKLLTDIYFVNNEVIARAWDVFETSEQDRNKLTALKIISDIQVKQIETLAKLGVLQKLEENKEGNNIVKRLLNAHLDQYDKMKKEQEAIKNKQFKVVKGEVIEVEPTYES